MEATVYALPDGQIVIHWPAAAMPPTPEEFRQLQRIISQLRQEAVKSAAQEAFEPLSERD